MSGTDGGVVIGAFTVEVMPPGPRRVTPLSGAKVRLVRLADEAPGGPASLPDACDKLAAACADLAKVFGKPDNEATFAAMDAVMEAMVECGSTIVVAEQAMLDADGLPPSPVAQEMSAATRSYLRRLTGKKSMVAALADVEVWRASHVARERRASTSSGPTTLSAREIAMCAEYKIDPKTYAASKPATKR